MLAAERSAGRITEAQFLVGRMIHAAFARGVGARLEGRFTERLERAIGAVGARFLRAVLVEGQTFAGYAEARGRGGDDAADHVAAHFRHLLEKFTSDAHLVMMS